MTDEQENEEKEPVFFTKMTCVDMTAKNLIMPFCPHAENICAKCLEKELQAHYSDGFNLGKQKILKELEFTFRKFDAMYILLKGAIETLEDDGEIDKNSEARSLFDACFYLIKIINDARKNWRNT